MTQFQDVPRFDEMLAIEAASETRADFICKTCMHLAGTVLVLIVAGLATGLNLGIFFTIAMIILACGHILYDTSNMMYHYRIGQHVACLPGDVVLVRAANRDVLHGGRPGHGFGWGGAAKATGRTRTGDLIITNDLLYQLSYGGRWYSDEFYPKTGRRT